MKAAVVGHGVIGKVHANILRDMGFLAAICDVNNDALQKLSDVAYFDNYIKMLDSFQLDAVHICTPHYLHADMIIEALSRNINVLCEKPLCIKKEDIPRILDAERNSSAILGVCHQNRYNPANLYIKDYIKDKEVQGGVGQVSWNRDEAYYSSAPWRGKKETEGGGVLINQALHTLDLMQWFCGMPESLSANVSTLVLKDKIEVEDTAVICAKGKAGFNFYATNGAVTDMPAEIILHISGKDVKILPSYVVVDGELITFGDSRKPKGAKACYGSGHYPLIEDFYSCIREGRPFPIDGTEGAKVIKLILAAYESHEKNITI